MESRSSLTKNAILYFALLIGFGVGIWLVAAAGSRLDHERPVAQAPAAPADQARAPAPDASLAGRVFERNLKGPLGVLLLQLITIIVAARLMGALFKIIGQPAVMGEMVAGIILGPSVLGHVWPGAMAFIFPPASLGPLQLLSQIGVILFMFIVGMDLNAQHLREKAHAAVMVSHASIIVPFFLGAALSLLIYLPLASASTPFLAFSLFMGIAMSITAFPVLARILEDHKMTRSRLGSTALACAAVDDVTAWCALAVVIAIAQAEDIAASALTIGLVLLFIAVMIFLIKPGIGRVFKEDAPEGSKRPWLIAGALAFAFACSWFTEVIGIHALFGAFLAGVAVPSTAGVRSYLKEKLESLSLSCLLPLFFAFTGLRTQINLLNDWQSWALCAGVIGVAVAGKLGGSMLMAKWTGMSWAEAFSIGVLMNTRGLMELVVLNIGYDLGILPARIFSIMVLMALATTSMAGPLLSWVKSRQPSEAGLPQGAEPAGRV